MPSLDELKRKIDEKEEDLLSERETIENMRKEYRKLQLAEKLTKQFTEKEDLKITLAKKHKLEKHPKLDELFRLAWEFGHSYGESEVEIFFDEMSGLLK